MKLILKSLLLSGLLFAVSAPNLMADRRRFVWSYHPVTLAEDDSELEFYQTTKLDDVNSWEYRIEVEHGLTPRWDLSIYQIFSQQDGEPFLWDAVQLRTRYRLSEPGRIPLDPVLYLEYRRKLNFSQQNKAEAKLLLGTDINQFTIALNPVYEFFWAPGDPVHEIGFDAGLTWEVNFKVSIGIESSSRIEFVKNTNSSTNSYIGPTISLASGPIWYTFGYAVGITDQSNDARARLLMGIDL